MTNLNQHRVRVDVLDEGILENIRNGNIISEKVEKYNEEILRPSINVSLAKEEVFLNARIKTLILLIDETQSVRKACDRMGLSYGKAWNMLNKLEDSLGYQIIIRKHGGSKGGGTALTDKGILFLKAYQEYEKKVLLYSQELFNELFLESDLL